MKDNFMAPAEEAGAGGRGAGGRVVGGGTGGGEKDHFLVRKDETKKTEKEKGFDYSFAGIMTVDRLTSRLRQICNKACRRNFVYR